MNPVQEIKQRHDMDILLRAIAPAAIKRQEARRRRETGENRINFVEWVRAKRKG